MIRRYGHAVDAFLPCANDPTGEGMMVIRLTDQMTKDGLVPQRICTLCLQAFPVTAFIKHQRFRTIGEHEYSVLVDDERCDACEPPPTLRFHFVANRLMMRLDLHDDSNDVIRIWDEKQQEWFPIVEWGVRRMTESNQLRLQPYFDRGHGKDGRRYGVAMDRFDW